MRILLPLILSAISVSHLQSAETNTGPITITINSSHGGIMVPAKINGSKPLSFLLDTGYGITTIHPELVESLDLKRVGRITISGIAGEEEAATYGGVIF